MVHLLMTQYLQSNEGRNYDAVVANKQPKKYRNKKETQTDLIIAPQRGLYITNIVYRPREVGFPRNGRGHRPRPLRGQPTPQGLECCFWSAITDLCLSFSVAATPQHDYYRPAARREAELSAGRLKNARTALGQGVQNAPCATGGFGSSGALD